MINRTLTYLLLFMLFIINISCDKTVTPEPEEPGFTVNTIFINSFPDSFSVFINGKVTGAVTPDSLRSIDTGFVTVTLSKPLYRDSVFTMKIENNKNYDLFFDIHANPLMLGSIQVNSTPPGATIFLNGDSLAEVTPFKITNLVPGQYEIYLKKEGHWDFVYPLTVQSNTTPVVNAALEDTTVWVIYNEKFIKHKINYTNTIDIDDNGYVWVGSVESGLFKYDGKIWTNYNTENSNIPDNAIRHLRTEGSKVWIATNAGVTLFNNGIFTTYNEFNSPLPSDIVFKIYIHNSKKYFATFARGFAVFDDVNWEIHSIENSTIPSNIIRCFSFDLNNNLWVGTADRGIAKFNGINWDVFNIKHADPFFSYNIASLSVNQDGIIIIGAVTMDPQTTPPNIGGLGILIGNNLSFRRNFPGARITDTKFDLNNRAWVLTTFGIFRFDNVNNFDNYYSFNTINSNIPVNHLNEIAFDQQGNKWFATFGGGVAKYKGD